MATENPTWGYTRIHDSTLSGKRLFLRDRDRKWSLAIRELLERSGVHVIQTPFRAPNCNAHAERFVRSIKEECLKRVIPLGEQHLSSDVGRVRGAQ
jgi:putative transposase